MSYKLWRFFRFALLMHTIKCSLFMGILNMLIYEEPPFLIWHFLENNTTKYLLSPRRERIEVRGDMVWRSTPTFALWSSRTYSTGQALPAYSAEVARLRRPGIEGGGDRWESIFIVRRWRSVMKDCPYFWGLRLDWLNGNGPIVKWSPSIKSPRRRESRKTLDFPRIKYGAGLVKPGMTNRLKFISSCIILSYRVLLEISNIGTNLTLQLRRK